MKFIFNSAALAILIKVSGCMPVMAANRSANQMKPQQNVPTSISRPPQYVMLAFDGSLNLSFWDASRKFSQQLQQEGKNVKFTYFLSGVYFLASENRKEYDAPEKGRGQSAIGFGGPREDLPKRVFQVNSAFQEGHEMASHANGHFDAAALKWTYEDWRSEFTQFNRIIFDLFLINRVSPDSRFPSGWLMRESDITGFRAPQLGVTKPMFQALKDFNFRYDTSLTNSANYWPQKGEKGLWNFPLAELKIVGTGKRTLSMDYNFYIAQSGGVSQPANKNLYKKQMLDTYLQYFSDNYHNNRAPLHIGHHFALWNDGAYWEALKEFAAAVCALPETKCVTYKEYTNWLESLDQNTLAAYRKGQFEKAQPLPQLNQQINRKTPVRASVRVAYHGQDTIMVRPLVFEMSELQNLRAQFSVNGKMTARSEINLPALRKLYVVGETLNITAHLYNLSGLELARSTQKLRDLGTEDEFLEADALETEALKGDLPAAHAEENNVLF
jgi:hypothetical protein